MRDYIAVALIAYLCGSIPFGYILVRLFRGQDVRATGSGNIGATNVARTAPGLGIATLILDAAKGLIAVLLSVFLFARIPATGQQAEYLATYQHAVSVETLAILFAVVGHMFPVWLRFRGGKGVATAVGGFLFISPFATLISFCVFALVVGLSRFVSLGSIIGAAIFPLSASLIDPSYSTPASRIFTLIASLLVIAKHHANIRRLLNGTENRFGKKKPEQIMAED